MSDILINIALVYAVGSVVTMIFTLGVFVGQGDEHNLGKIHKWCWLALVWPQPLFRAAQDVYRDRRNG